MASYIEIQHVFFSYREKTIFEDFSLSFEEGKGTAILAPSGKGKSTLLHLLSGLLVPKKGSIVFPNPHPRISMVFQENRLLESFDAFENIKLVNSRLSNEDIKELLSALKLNDCCNKMAKQLSGGQARRLALARALAYDYDLLLLDEPFTGLDTETKRDVIKFIKKKTLGKTLVLVTHDPEDVKALSLRTITLFE